MKVAGICKSCGQYYRGVRCGCRFEATAPARSTKYGVVNTDLQNNDRLSGNLGVTVAQWSDPKTRKRLAEIHPGARFVRDGNHMKMEITSRKDKLTRMRERGIATGQKIEESD